MNDTNETVITLGPRHRIQVAVDNIVAGRATDSDYATLTDHALMYSATGDQACAILGTAMRHPLPPEVYTSAAQTLRTRWLQRPSNKPRSRGGLRLPVGWSEATELPTTEPETTEPETTEPDKKNKGKKA